MTCAQINASVLEAFRGFFFHNPSLMYLCSGICILFERSFMQNLTFQNSKVVRLCNGACITFGTTRVQNLMHNVVRVICRVFCRVIFLPGGKNRTPLQLCTGLLIHTLCDVALVYWELVRNLCTTYVEFFHAAFEPCAVRYRPLVVPCKMYAKLLCPCQTSTLWNDAVF